MQIKTSTLTFPDRSDRRLHKSLQTLLLFSVLGVAAVAMAQTSPAPATPENSARESREEILKTFQREAQAAYAEAKQACAPMPAADRTICLAKARLQFDDDMRYATKRADMGY
jgi:hypothetical protein